MKLDRKQTVLLIGLSILLFRVLSVVASIGIMQLRRIPLEFLMHVAEILRAYEPVMACGVGVFLAILLMRKLRKAHLALVVVVWVLALLPLQFRVRQEVMLASPPTVEPSAVQPLALTARVIDGESISDTVLLGNAQVARAEAVPLHDDVYQVKLHLTPEGRDVIRATTRRHVGKQIGFFLDGDLKSSPEILEPLDIPYIMLPIRTTAVKAEQIARGIMKETSQQQN